MKKIKIILIACLFLQYAKAQDLIYKKDKTVLKTMLIDIGAEEIKYKEYIYQSGPVSIIKKSEVEKIVTEKGKEIFFDQSITNSFDKKNAIKIGILSWRLTHLSFSYERSLAPARSLELQLGIIGIGRKYDTDIESAGGVFTRFGYKFKRSPEYYRQKGKEPHLLKGLYLRPEITFGYVQETWYKAYYDTYFGYSYLTSVGEQKEKAVFYAAMLNIGQQWVIADDFLIDIFGGVGFGGNTGKRREINYAFLGPNPLFINGGIKFGLLFK